MTLRDALSMFVARRCDVLPVANQQGEPCGTLHFRDLLSETSPVKRLCDPLLWLIVLFLLLLFGLPYSQPFFAALFPDLPRPVYQQESLPPSRSPISGWWASQVCLPSWWASAQGLRSREKVGRSFVPGGDYRRRRADLSPVAVLAIAVPVMGFGQQPAIIALILYGVLPILQATLAGLGAVPASVMSVASGMGMSRRQQLYQVELPLAAPVILAGIEPR